MCQIVAFPSRQFCVLDGQGNPSVDVASVNQVVSGRRDFRRRFQNPENRFSAGLVKDTAVEEGKQQLYARSIFNLLAIK